MNPLLVGTLGALAVGAGAVFVWFLVTTLRELRALRANAKKGRQSNGTPQLTKDDLVGLLDDFKTKSPLEKRVFSLEEEVESLGRRFETLNKDALRYLQRGAKALNRAEAIREEEGGEDPPSSSGGAAVPAATAPPAQEDVQAYARRRIRELGEDPM